MINHLFIATIAALIVTLFSWSFRTLQTEKWQILGTVPHHKCGDDSWSGTNFTYYGFFTASAVAFAITIGLILFGALQVALTSMIVLSLVIMVPSFAAAKMVAAIVEKKSATFSIGGASFVGIILCPWLILAVQRFQGLQIEIVSALAVLSIAYTFGESLGRLACISFGCCYGKRISELSPGVGRWFKSISFVFSGKLKKISYAHQMEGEAVVPIQGITSVIYAITGMVGIYLFLQGYHTVAFLLTLVITQIWRLFSEFLRADYRGEGKISAYQIMGLLSVIYSVGVALLFPQNAQPAADLVQGLQILWNPGVILFIELAWIFTFFFTGRSQVTGATMVFNVQTHRI